MGHTELSHNAQSGREHSLHFPQARFLDNFRIAGHPDTAETVRWACWMVVRFHAKVARRNQKGRGKLMSIREHTKFAARKPQVLKVIG